MALQSVDSGIVRTVSSRGIVKQECPSFSGALALALKPPSSYLYESGEGSAFLQAAKAGQVTA